MPEPHVADLLERLFVAGVAITTRALNEATPDLDLTFPQWRVLLDRRRGLGWRDRQRGGCPRRRDRSRDEPPAAPARPARPPRDLARRSRSQGGQGPAHRTTGRRCATRSSVYRHRTHRRDRDRPSRLNRHPCRAPAGGRRLRRLSMTVAARGVLDRIRRRTRSTAYLRKWVVLGALIGVIAGLGAAAFFWALEQASALFLGTLAGFHPATPVGEGGAPIVDSGASLGDPVRGGAGRPDLGDHRLPARARGGRTRN